MEARVHAKVHRCAQDESPHRQQIKQAQNAAKDEFGVTHENIIYSETENKVFCVLNAPNKEAVEKYTGRSASGQTGYTKSRLRSNHPVRNWASFLLQLPICNAF